jgi:hypothetical protein
MYGGMPGAMLPQVKHVPPLIELHGEAMTMFHWQRARSS